MPTYELVGSGASVFGQTITVQRVTSDQDVPGQGKESYAVSVSAAPGHPGQAAGFATFADAKRFIGSFTSERFGTFDTQGNKTNVERQGLGVPSGMVAYVDTPGK